MSAIVGSPESALHWNGRIGAIGRVVLAPALFGGVDLESLVLDELLLQAARPERYAVGGPECRLSPPAAELMSLAIHELATNAVKFGALSQPQSKIRVAWEIVARPGTQALQFEWLESGVAMNAGAPISPGFGFELVERLIARELKGEGRMTLLADGVRCIVELPLEHAQSPRE